MGKKKGRERNGKASGLALCFRHYDSIDDIYFSKGEGVQDGDLVSAHTRPLIALVSVSTSDK